MKYLKSVTFLLFISVFILICNISYAGTLSLNFNDINDTKLVFSEKGDLVFKGKNFVSISKRGEPDLPYKKITVLLPPEADLNNIIVNINNVNYEKKEIFNDITPVKEPKSHDSIKYNYTLNNVYTTNSLFPNDWVAEKHVGKIREWKILDLYFSLYRYNPILKELYKLNSINIDIIFEDLLSNSYVKADHIAADIVKNIAVNYNEMSKKYNISQALNTEDLRSNSSVGYLIITTNNIINNIGELENFIEHKESLGYVVYTINENDWGGRIGDNGANNIRQWLIDNYLEKHIKYVLIIGNPSTTQSYVPMKMLTPADEGTPSDFYYSELTSNFDHNNNNIYGEFYGDFTYIDLNCDVFVGRIPYYDSYEEVNNILKKIIKYENSTNTSWRKNVLFPMKPYDADTPNYNFAEDLINNILVDSWNYYKIYDEDYSLSEPPNKTPCTIDNVMNAWIDYKFGLVVWKSHGWYTSATDVITIDDVPYLNDNYPSIVSSISCLTSYPERKDNLGFSLLKNGSIAFIGATRITWYISGKTTFGDTGTNGDIMYRFTDYLVNDEISIGEAFYRALELRPSYDKLLMNYFAFNIYGDPSISIVTESYDDINYYILSGKVVDEDETAVVNFDINISNGSEDILLVTDSNGEFSIELEEGEYILQVDGLSYNIDLNEDYDIGTIVIENTDDPEYDDDDDYHHDGGGCGLFRHNYILLILPLILLKTKR